jgi:hypothetical protein
VGAVVSFNGAAENSAFGPTVKRNEALKLHVIAEGSNDELAPPSAAAAADAAPRWGRRLRNGSHQFSENATPRVGAHKGKREAPDAAGAQTPAAAGSSALLTKASTETPVMASGRRTQQRYRGLDGLAARSLGPMRRLAANHNALALVTQAVQIWVLCELLSCFPFRT